MKKNVKVQVKAKKASVVDCNLTEIAKKEYYKYGVAVNEDRAIIGSLDGLKPVMRRVLWATYKLGLRHTAKAEKAALIVGECLGKYHPHGDIAVYDSMVNAANSPMRMIDGEGNWGTLTDSAAAQRYTNARLTKYSDLTFFDKFYIPTIQYVPNYDGSQVEPLVLPTLLPNSLLNGNFGIGVGTITRSPSYTLPSVLRVLKKVAKGEAITPALCNQLEFTSKYGGCVYDTPDSKKAKKEFYKTGKARFVFDSVYEGPNSNNEIRIARFAPFSSIEKVLTNCNEKYKGIVDRARDDSDPNDPYKKAYVVRFKSSLKGQRLQDAIDNVMLEFCSDVQFDIKVTDRYVDDKGFAAASLRSATIPELLQNWWDYRLELERNACAYWIEARKKEIQLLELLIHAIKYLDFIFAALKNKSLKDASLLNNHISKGLKISVEDAKIILDRPTRSLSALEDSKMKAEVQELLAEIKTYEKRRKKPEVYVLDQLSEMEAALK